MRLLPAVLLTLSLTSPLRADDADSWTQFRGPNGSGVSAAKGLPTTWDEKTNVAWKVPIPGKGWSSPVVLGKQVWLTTAPADGKARSVLCLDRDTGKVVHDIKVFDTPKPLYTHHDFNSHASPSPVIEKGRVYAHFGAGGTAAIDTATGEVLWRRTDLKNNHWRGPGSSPVLWEDLLFLTFDGYDRQFVVALNKNTGKTVWEKDRSINYKTNNGDLRKAYSTPVLVTVNGKPQLVSTAAVGTVAYEPRTGKEIWKVHHGGMNAACPPMVGHGLVMVTIGYGSRVVAIRPTGTGDVTGSEHVAWTFGKSVPSRPAPLLAGDLIFMVSDSGVLTCVEAKTGKGVGTRRIGDKFTASPVLADGHLYCCDQEDGKCYVVEANRDLKLVATNPLDAGCMASPAVAGKSLFVRTKKSLYRIERKESAGR